MGKDDKLLKEIMGLENKELAVLLLNYREKINDISSKMVDSLKLLDKFSENYDNKKVKQDLRKIILDNFNDLPRDTKYFIGEFLKKIKEE